MDSLVADLHAHDLHVTTGNLCTRYLFEVLSREGRGDLAIGILSQTSYPSYGYMIEHGATTIWERWELGGTGMNSYNHPMYGSVALWMHRDLAGLDLDELAPGFSRARIRPRIPPQIEHARASLQTVRGRVAVSWRKSGPSLLLDLEIPANMEAELILPPEYSGALTEGGTVLAPTSKGGKIPGMGRIAKDPGGWKLALGSGAYHFEVGQA